jgi:GDP-4-dehydro-6-deoxy-D-mannose reductase
MKALVTGAAGFVGGHLVPALRDAGWRVTTLDARPPADLVGDLSRLPFRGFSFDVVFHLAGFSNPAASLEAAREAYAANAAATARLVRDLRAGRFVIASSAHVYGDVAPRDNPVDESRRPAPRTPYAAAKLCGEALALASERDVVILRPFNHTGPGQSAAYLCPALARQVARGRRTIEVADLAPRRDFFDVRDMVRAYLLAAERGRPGEVYNVGTGSPVSVEEIARTLLSLARLPARLRGDRGRPDVLSGDSAKFRRATGWCPAIPLRRTLADLLAFERARLLPSATSSAP